MELQELLKRVSDDILIELISQGENPIHHIFLESGFTCLGPLVRKSTNLGWWKVHFKDLEMTNWNLIMIRNLV